MSTARLQNVFYFPSKVPFNEQRCQSVHGNKALIFFRNVWIHCSLSYLLGWAIYWFEQNSEFDIVTLPILKLVPNILCHVTFWLLHTSSFVLAGHSLKAYLHLSPCSFVLSNKTALVLADPGRVANQTNETKARDLIWLQIIMASSNREPTQLCMGPSI